MHSSTGSLGAIPVKAYAAQDGAMRSTRARVTENEAARQPSAQQLIRLQAAQQTMMHYHHEVHRLNTVGRALGLHGARRQSWIAGKAGCTLRDVRFLLLVPAGFRQPV